MADNLSAFLVVQLQKPEAQHLTQTHCSKHADKRFRLGSASWHWSLWWILSILPFEYLLLHSLLRFQSSPPSPTMMDSQVSRNLSSFIAPSLRNRSPFQFICLSFSFSLFLMSFALPHSVEISLPLESLGSSSRVQKVFCKSCSTCRLFLIYLWGGKGSPCLTPPPCWKSL